jgi:hypothetical protein
MSRVGAGWVPALMVLTAISGPGAAGDEVDPRAYWAPVIVQHQDRGLIESYPVPLGDDGDGEFTLYAWEDSDETHLRLGYFWQYSTGDALAVVLELERRDEDRDRLAGALLAGPEACRWVDADHLRTVQDAVGRHPLVSVRDGTPSAGLGDLAAVLPEQGVIDWSDVPQAGRSYPRAWQDQAHLPRGTPASDGVVLRHEPEGGYRQAGRRGRGNMPHHWNLLAYRLRNLERDADALRSHPAEPMSWPCAGVFEDAGAALAERRPGNDSP